MADPSPNIPLVLSYNRKKDRQEEIMPLTCAPAAHNLQLQPELTLTFSHVKILYDELFLSDS